MHKVTKVKILEGVTNEMLESVINRYLDSNKNEVVVDVKYIVYETDVDEEFLDDVEDERENRFSALLIFGEEY